MQSGAFYISFKSIIENNIKAVENFEVQSSGNYTLFLNGILYDCELVELLNNYIKFGVKALKQIDGDFTLIIKQDQTIKVYRDRHGVGSQVFFNEEKISSHLIHFSADKNEVLTPNYEALMTYLSIGYIPSPMTALKGVQKLAAGSVLTFKDGHLNVENLYPWEEYYSHVSQLKISVEEATEEYERLHKKAILSRIKDSSKVGLLLSGGYDSGGNISALRDVFSGDVVSYSIGFKNNPWTELPLAKVLSERYNSKHFECEIDGSEIMSLPSIIKETGDPFQEGGLMVNFTAMQLVSKSGECPDIILGGDGNDQHFGTSGKELALHWNIKNRKLQMFQQMFDRLGNKISYFNNDNIAFRAEFHNRKILHIQQSDMFGFQLYDLNRINNINLNLSKLAYDVPVAGLYDSFEKFFAARNFNIDIKQVINEVILYKSSRMSELFDNRISFPYMSTELYDFLNKLPVEYKFKGSLDDLAKGRGVSKFIHKNYLEEKLPKEITDRKKQGGFAPLPTFFQDKNQRNQLFNYIRNSAGINHLFKMTRINAILNEYNSIANINPYWFWNRQVKANQINSLLTLAVWWDIFIERNHNINSINDLLKS